MAVADTQQLGELVECADVAVRVASQLRLLKAGKPVRDSEALASAVEFLKAAVAGGEFMSSGQSLKIQATLRPLNWAADVRVRHELSEVDYDDLAKFLQGIRDALQEIQTKARPNDKKINSAIKFFASLGEILGIRAEQTMRQASGPFGNVSSL